MPLLLWSFGWVFGVGCYKHDGPDGASRWRRARSIKTP